MSEPFSIGDAASLAAVPVLVLLNGFFVAAEFALVTIRPTEVEELAKQDRPGARAASEAVRHLDQAIAATQLGITLASLLLGWLGERSIASLLAPVLQVVLGHEHQLLLHTIAAGVALTFITLLHVILGELAPKTIALQRPRSVALIVARPLLLFERLFGPVIRLMNGLGDRFVRLLGLAPVTSHARAHSLGELTTLVDETRRAGILKAEQAEVVKRVFRLQKKIVRDVMLPLERVDMIDLRWTPDQALDTVIEGAHTRMPVHDGPRTNVVGIVNAKDLFHLYRLKGIVNVQDVMRKAVFVRPEEPLEDLLQSFRAGRLHLAIVRGDEGVIGIITLEDVVEQIVGAIEDEHD